MTTYTFNEPQTSFSTEQVCLELFTGNIEETLDFIVQWTEDTATEGLPTAGGDYDPQGLVFELAPGARENCIDIRIYRDNSFEIREEFGGVITDVRLPDGSQVPATGVQGITVTPMNTRVLINNIDGEDVR